MIKKMHVLLIVAVLLISFVGCSNNNETTDPSNDNSQMVEYGVAGNITEITKSDDGSTLGTIKVEGPENNGATYDKAIVTITKDTKIYSNDDITFEDLEEGMYVNVFFEGPAKESYPVQATAKQVNVVPEDSNNDKDDDND